LDYAKLRGAIREKFGRQADFAEAMGFSDCVLSQKLNNRSEWTKGEMEKACQLLGFSAEDIPALFFAVSVEISQLEEPV
jgi:hypothetical protein